MDTIGEIELEQRRAERVVREDAELFGQLMAHRGWGRYMALVEAIAQNYHVTVMKPLDSTLECTKVEFAKGVLSGMSLATSIPSMKIREAQELRRQTNEE